MEPVVHIIEFDTSVDNKSIYFILRNILTREEIDKLIEEYNEPNSNVFHKVANVFFEASMASVVVFKNVVLTNENIQQFDRIEKIRICGNKDEKLFKISYTERCDLREIELNTDTVVSLYPKLLYDFRIESLYELRGNCHILDPRRGLCLSKKIYTKNDGTYSEGYQIDHDNFICKYKYLDEFAIFSMSYLNKHEWEGFFI